MTKVILSCRLFLEFEFDKLFLELEFDKLEFQPKIKFSKLEFQFVIQRQTAIQLKLIETRV